MSSRTEQWPPSGLRLRESAKALVIRGDKLLIVKEHHEDGSRFWTLPGGGVKQTESRRGALRRELHEELKCQGTVGERVTRFWYAHTGQSNTVSRWFVYNCALVTTATPNLKEGVLDKRWVTLEQLPPGTLPQVRYLAESRLSEDSSKYERRLES